MKNLKKSIDIKNFIMYPRFMNSKKISKTTMLFLAAGVAAGCLFSVNKINKCRKCAKQVCACSHH
jgi:hypothetical protein